MAKKQKLNENCEKRHNEHVTLEEYASIQNEYVSKNEYDQYGSKAELQSDLDQQRQLTKHLTSELLTKENQLKLAAFSLSFSIPEIYYTTPYITIIYYEMLANI